MVKFHWLKMDGVFYGYYTKDVLSNGQVISIFFFRSDTIQSIEYSVILLIANKKKTHQRMAVGGKRSVFRQEHGEMRIGRVALGKEGTENV